MDQTTNETETKVVKETKTVRLEGMSFTQEESKRLFKEAMKEWLSEQRKELEVTIGKWVIRIVTTALIFALGYFILKMSGWGRII